MTKTYTAARAHPWRTIAVLLILAASAVTAFLVSRQDTYANLSPSTFEIYDGNTHANDGTLGHTHDWSQVYDPGTYGANGADKALFIPDTSPADDQPATGATKDPYDMDTWDCKAAGVSPPKNDMANAFVAIYTVDGHQIIYFGLDRINSDNGNADVGFWILKDDHSCDLTTGKWNNQKHSEGDTLITSEFTGGGSVSSINIFVWCSDPASPNLKCGSSTALVGAPGFKVDGPLQLKFKGQDCRDSSGTPISLTTQLACATVNRTSGSDGPEWPYTGAGTPSDKYERGAFFEGGIDSTGLGLDLQCVGTFIADTRSSQSTTAQLHDFALGQVDSCDASVSTQSSTTSTTVVPGTQVSDTATVTVTSGLGTDPTGTVKFFLCGPGLADSVTTAGCPTGGTQIGTAKTVNGGSPNDGQSTATSDLTSSSQTLGIGKYCWRAEYSGDSNYPSKSHTNATTECFTTVKQPSNTATSSSATGTSVVPGTSVTDTATVSGGTGQPTPTGTVDFYLCQPSEVTSAGCPSGSGTKIGSTQTLDSSGQATSGSTTNTTTIGKYCWRAEYSGDSFYLASSHTNALTSTTGGVTPECFITVKQPSTTATSSSATGTSVVPGTSVTDTATVSGGAGQPTPTGTVDFYLCQPSEVDSTGCPSGSGTKIGSTQTLDSSGQATSGSTTNTTTIGKYCWRAEYSGDSFYLASSHTNALTSTTGGVTPECFITVKQPSTTATSASPSGSVLAGQSVTDTATVSGGAGQPTPTGTVDFYLCQPSEVDSTGCPSGSGTKVGATKTLSSGQATSDAATNTTTIGKYCWRAEYSGDSFYLASSHTNALTSTTEGVTPECFVTFNPTTVVSISDRIVGLPSDATGTVTYGVYTDSACTVAVTTGTPSDGDITPDVNTVGSGGVAPMSKTYTPDAAGTFYIKATFTGTGTYSGVTFSDCSESAALTF